VPDVERGRHARQRVAHRQRNVGNTFATRTLVIDGNERLAYTWDATRPDGTAVTGIDVCVLQDGRVTLNWTVPAAERSALPDGPGIEVLHPTPGHSIGRG
jgi:hypothetical protein